VYHDHNRKLQDQFGTRALADRLVERLTRTRFTDADRDFVETLAFFFLATADAQARPDCSFKGGMPGFVRIMAPDLLVFPDYDGNGMFKSLGNIRANPQIGLLFIAMGEQPRRLRVNGRAEVSEGDPLSGEFPGAQLIVRVTPEFIFPNCARYIPSTEVVRESMHLPKEGCEPVEPGWKSRPEFSDVVPPRRT
jgi:predicted pyridoxine 5'-phosphate oxidase superfamily flavin-nucleotide-binding protein